MNNTTIGDKKYLLYVDILGFKDIVRKKPPEDIYAIVDNCLEVFYRLERLNQIFSPIYFSDTIIFYQSCEEYIETAFADIYAMAGNIFTTLMASGIPIRGVISFGDFNVKNDSQNRNNIFYGDTLIEAYETESKQKFIGIVLTPTAYKNISQDTLNALINENVFYKMENGNLYLNPFYSIRGFYYYENPLSEGGRDLIEELKVFKLIHKIYERLIETNGNQDVILKYKNTIDLLQSVMGKEMYLWAQNTSKIL